MDKTIYSKNHIRFTEKPFFFFLFLLTLSCTSPHQNQTEKKILSRFESIQDLKGAVVSAYVVDMRSKKVLASLNENYRLTPASLSKVLTSAAALTVLGPGFTFKTEAGINSDVSNGILNGDLIIKGGGDPALGSRYFSSANPDVIFNKILSFLKERGIRSVDGSLVIVSDYFLPPRYPSLRVWEDMSNYYGAPPCGLSFLDNSFTVTLQSPSRAGALCRVTGTEPDCGIEFVCRVRASNSQKDSAYIYGYPGLQKWYIDGSIPAGRKSFRIKGAIPEPEKIFGRQLFSFLKKHGTGIKNLTFKTSSETGNYKVIGKIESPPLSSVIKVMNKRSVNLFADHLFLMLAKNEGKANWDNARKVISAFWQKSIGQNSIYLHDGSGLSPFNRCSARDMTNALVFMSHSRYNDEFKASLAVSGIDGTLKNIWGSAGTKGKVLGKSGSMKGVLGYAGYITTKQDRTLAFCIIVNNFTDSYKEVKTRIEQEVTKIILDN